MNGDATLELYRAEDDPLERDSLLGTSTDDVSTALLTRLREALARPAPPAAASQVDAARVPRVGCASR